MRYREDEKSVILQLAKFWVESVVHSANVIQRFWKSPKRMLFLRPRVLAIKALFFPKLFYMRGEQVCKLNRRALFGKMGFTGPQNSVGVPKNLFLISVPPLVVDQRRLERDKVCSISEEFKRLDEVYRSFLAKIPNALSVEDQTDLFKRGIGAFKSELAKLNILSIKRKYGNEIEKEMGKQLPGLRGLENASVASGLFVPAYSPSGEILGAQIKTSRPRPKPDPMEITHATSGGETLSKQLLRTVATRKNHRFKLSFGIVKVLAALKAHCSAGEILRAH